MQPFADLDLTDQYIKHNVVLYAHDHPTEPDGINAGVKALESALKAFDLPDAPLSCPALQVLPAGVGAQGTRPATWEFTGRPFVFAAKLRLITPGVVFQAAMPSMQPIFQFMITDIGGGVCRLYCQIGSTVLADNAVTYQGHYPQTVGVIVDTTTVQFFSGHLLSGSPVGYEATLPEASATVVHTIGGSGCAADILRIGVRTYGNDLGLSSVFEQCALPVDLADYHQPRMYYTPDVVNEAMTDQVNRWENGGAITTATLPLIAGAWTAWG